MKIHIPYLKPMNRKPPFTDDTPIFMVDSDGEWQSAHWDAELGKYRAERRDDVEGEIVIEVEDGASQEGINVAIAQAMNEHADAH